MVKLDGNNLTGFRILDLKGTFQDRKLQPMVPVKLRDQISWLVTKGELFGISWKHDLRDVNTKKLFLLRFGIRVEKHIVDGAFCTTDDRLLAILIKISRLMFHINLLFQFEIAFAKNEDFPLQSHIDVLVWTHGRENLHRFTFAWYCGDQAQIVWAEEVHLMGVFPDELICVTLQLVTPGKNELRADILNVGWLKIVEFYGAVRTVVNS